MINIIAAIGKNHELGKDNQLIFRIKQDMQFFKNTTMGHPILMGRKTFESIGHPLPGRTNYVITRHPENLPDNVEPVHQLRQFLENWQDSEARLFVIGGAMVYFEALPYAKHLYLTEVDASIENADSSFPLFDKSNYSQKLIKKGSENGLKFTITQYIKK